MTSFVALAIFIGLFVLGFAVTAGTLVLGARLARIPDVGFKRALAAVLFYSSVGLLVQLLVFAIDGDRHPFAALAIVLAALFVTWKVVQRVLRTSLGRAILAWLPTLLAIPAGLILVRLTQLFVLEAYLMPTNGMAPTIVGEHLETQCPRCGGKMVVSAYRATPPSRKDLGICEKCLRTATVQMPAGEAIIGDRLLAAKYLAPRRWDLIVFLLPSDSSTSYAMRLVGMPGEEVAVRDGEVWINGRVVEKPKEISGLCYSGGPGDPGFSGTEDSEQADWGPATLGDDEYFVLGDFSRRSADARCWITGAPGHPPYAVPESHLVGVVTHIYWPPSRWRNFR